MKKLYFCIVTTIIGIIVTIALIGYSRLADNVLSYVTISINPEIELALNSYDEVVEVIPINSDADILISDLDLIGLTVEEASEQIIDSAMETGYLDEYSDENTVIVTTVNNDDEVRKELEEKVLARMNAHFEERKIYAFLVAKGLDDELKSEAESYNISYGKMLLIERAISLNESLSKNDLINMSIREIQSEIKSYIKERHDALKKSVQEARIEWQSQKTQLKLQYSEEIEALKAQITEEHKEEFQNMTEYQKKGAIKNYLDARKQKIQEDVSAVKEEIKSDIKDDMKDYNYPIYANNEAIIKQKVKERIEQRRNSR